MNLKTLAHEQIIKVIQAVCASDKEVEIVKEFCISANRLVKKCLITLD